MPTLQEITLAHSRRLSEIYRSRDIRLAQAQSLRDLQLRSLPAAARIFAHYDDEVSGAREKQLATESKAEAARSGALLAAIDRRSDRLEDLQHTRRAADVDAVQAWRRDEEAANRKYEAALAALRALPAKDRAAAAADAERSRRTELDQARTAHDEALAAAQRKYRAAVDEALVDERRDSRDGERAYLDAMTHAAAAAHGAKQFADQGLAAALAALPEAAEVVRSWRAELTTIASETSAAEQDAFARFRHDLDALRV